MEVYCTKKVETADGFAFDVPDTLPYIHLITPEVVVRCDHNDNFYIADCPGDASFIQNIIKFKKVMSKSAVKALPDAPDRLDKDKLKLQDEVIWVKPSPVMIYKKSKEHVKFNKMLLNHPVRLQLSFQASNLHALPRPYNTYNAFFTCDYVLVGDDFEWSILAA